MHSLLRRLHVETFVLNLGEELDTPPELAGFTVRRVDAHTLEVDVSKEQSVNDVFSQLSSLGLDVVSMRNKTNRLEEMFLSLVESS